MSLASRLPYQNGSAPARSFADESDDEEEALVNDYKEQVQYEDGGVDDGLSDLDRVASIGQGSGMGSASVDDIQSRLQAAAMQLEYGASMDTKFASYDNYCSLFHYILNSDGPVDLEVPSVWRSFLAPCSNPFFSWEQSDSEFSNVQRLSD